MANSQGNMGCYSTVNISPTMFLSRIIQVCELCEWLGNNDVLTHVYDMKLQKTFNDVTNFY